MMKNKIVMTVLAGLSLFAAGATYAQRLNPALDTQRAQSLQVQLAAAQPLTFAERQAAWFSNKADYRRRSNDNETGRRLRRLDRYSIWRVTSNKPVRC